MLPTFGIEVTRDDRWWMITVPDLAGHVSADGAVNRSPVTQARNAGEVDQMARDFIATVTGLSIEDVTVKQRD